MDDTKQKLKEISDGIGEAVDLLLHSEPWSEECDAAASKLEELLDEWKDTTRKAGDCECDTSYDVFVKAVQLRDGDCTCCTVHHR